MNKLEKEAVKELNYLTSFGNKAPEKVTRFTRYSITGAITLLVDIFPTIKQATCHELREGILPTQVTLRDG